MLGDACPGSGGQELLRQVGVSDGPHAHAGGGGWVWQVPVRAWGVAGSLLIWAWGELGLLKVGELLSHNNNDLDSGLMGNPRLLTLVLATCQTANARISGWSG